MFTFRPARSSSPAKSTKRISSTANTEDVSRLSHSSNIPELAGLSPEDVELIDTIIERAGPTATTFLPVFKAYNDVLLERGLDPHGAKYYGELLKLGTLKGSSWQDKWDTIKAQNGYGSKPRKLAPPKAAVTALQRNATSGMAIPSRAGPSTILSDDLFSSGLRDSQMSCSENSSIEDGPYALAASSTVFPSRKGSGRSTLTQNSLGLELDEDFSPPHPKPLPSQAPFRRTARTMEYDTSEPITSTPLSHRVNIRNFPATSSSPISSELVSSSPQLPPKRPSIIPKFTERGNTALNEEDAWKKVAMMQDEKEADMFRKDRLMERCFDVWRQGFQWIITTNEQIDDARDNLLVRKLFQLWHQRTSSYRNMEERVQAFDKRRCQRIFFSIWKQRFRKRVKEKQQAEWRRDMRQKMQVVRIKRDMRILKEAWTTWGRSHRLIVADQYFDEQLITRLFHRWRTRVREAVEKEAVANEIAIRRMDRVVESFWDHWRASTDLSRTEAVVRERVELRIKSKSLDTWNKKMYDLQNADAFYNVNIAKRFIRSWKAARDRIQYLEVRADKHIIRQDDVLLRAVMRVWKAHERGQLLEKVRAFLLVKTVWATWKAQIDHHRKLADLALHFSTRLNSSSTIHALSTWRQALAAKKNDRSRALQYYFAHVNRRALLQWRLQLHAKLQLTKKARLAEKIIVLHRSWNRIRDKYQDRVAEKNFQTFTTAKVKKIFAVWISLSQKSRQQRQAEDLIVEQVRRRILSNSLTHWTNRVIELKVRELEVSQRNEAALLISAFNRWKVDRARHVEELGLMESYEDIKRHENMRKIFTKWLTAARAARHHRDVLRQKEEEIKLRTIEIAWDRWRERFQEERLRPLEHTLLLQNKEALKYRAFAMWFSKTQSLPAIHFDSKRVKTRYWKAWMSAMPRALQARTAREVDKKAIFKKYLGKWLQEYRTKLSLKAVARARYFPAPAASAPTTRPPRPFMPPLSYAPRNNTPRTRFPRRTGRSVSPEREAVNSDEPLPVPKFVGLGNRLKTPGKAVSEVSPTRTLISEIPRTRASSPARSTKSSVPAPWYMRERDRSPVRSPAPSSVGGFEERTSLWQELQNVRRKSQTPSERSRPGRKPP
ncbi:Sfi1 spindle body protein-domain-containing protein [Lentinula raphanica]|uniref:Sfi1 spindle body protein-domain-containing protein n=1 Tax=Lentinula raphanica TaxID=153919 RepID=A0AA38PK98_9AGAR|nr:Sfi1 spindle body protein-domain-containing protein [Lentinula raphanica]KAJ3971988.1 Sfi1 spindle body protein-domain-containing protein [Lentinula raphanica]